MKLNYRLISQEKLNKKNGGVFYVSRVLIVFNSNDLLYARLISPVPLESQGTVDLNFQRFLEKYVFYVDNQT